MNKKLYTSDTHWGHRNIIKYSNRINPRTAEQYDLTPQGVQQMDADMVANWNSVVGPDDDVYHLGDFAMGKDAVPSITARLNGRIHLIWGNHDSEQVRNLPCWASSQPYLEINDQGTKLVLSHYAHRVWNRSHHGALMLYGHSHGSLPGTDQSLDVGVDCWNMTPTDLEQIKRRMRSLPPYSSGDHHVSKRND